MNMYRINMYQTDESCDNEIVLISDDNKVVIRANNTRFVVELYDKGVIKTSIREFYKSMHIDDMVQFFDELTYRSDGHKGHIECCRFNMYFTSYDDGEFWWGYHQLSHR